MLKKTLKGNSVLYLVIAVVVILLFRLLLTSLIPLLDKTESRYALIAKVMVETQEWAVLQIRPGQPFWAKPPLSTWLSALSFEVFGFNEFAARLPSYLMNLFVIFILGKWVKRAGISFFIIAFILLTTPEFLIHSGVVSTDTALAFSVTFLMLSFWKAMQGECSLIWKYTFFVALGLGFLAKGPIILVLTVPPITIWIFLQKIKIIEVFKRLPWVSGLILTALISLPWYIITEQRSPGFIDYFLVGEHFNRFLKPSWKGDLYGGPKSQALGMIWVFLMALAFPWIQIVLYKIWKQRMTIFKDNWLSFLVLWLLWTPFFFTFSKNILHTYTLPIMVPMALLMAYWWNSYSRKKTLLILGSIFPIIAILAFAWLSLNKSLNHYLNSDKYLLANQQITTTNKSTPLYYWERVSISGEFYSNNTAQYIIDGNQLDSVLKMKRKLFLVIPNKYIKDIPETLKVQSDSLGSNYKTSIFNFRRN